MRRTTPNLRRRPLGQEATDLIRRLILRGELSPGERLVEERLGDLLGLSRTPIREALHRLEQEALLTKRPRGGYEVRPLTVREVEETMGVRGVLEAYAAELAARQASPKVLRELDRCLEQFEEALARQDEERLLELNVRFHDLLYQASDSQLLQRLLGELKDELERISRVMMSNMPAGHWSAQEHRAVVEAIKAHDGATAGRLAKEHVERGGHWLISHLQGQESQA
jgi:DNA-binding GntR family transcriptional regulator